MKIEILNFSGSRGQLLGVYWSRHSRSSALVQVIVRENGRSQWWFQLSRKESPTLSFLWKTLGFERLLVFSLEFFNAYKNLPIGAISFLKYLFPFLLLLLLSSPPSEWPHQQSTFSASGDQFLDYSLSCYSSR